MKRYVYSQLSLRIKSHDVSDLHSIWVVLSVLENRGEYRVQRVLRIWIRISFSLRLQLIKPICDQCFPRRIDRIGAPQCRLLEITIDQQVRVDDGRQARLDAHRNLVCVGLIVDCNGAVRIRGVGKVQVHGAGGRGSRPRADDRSARFVGVDIDIKTRSGYFLKGDVYKSVPIRATREVQGGQIPAHDLLKSVAEYWPLCDSEIALSPFVSEFLLLPSKQARNNA